MAAYAAVEMWFLVLLRFAVLRDAFIPLDVSYAIALYATYLITGLLWSAAAKPPLSLLRWESASAAAALQILLLSAARIAIHFRRMLVPVAAMVAALLIIAVVPRLRTRYAFLLTPWSLALLLVAPDSIAFDYLFSVTPLVRGIVFSIVALVIATGASFIKRTLSFRSTMIVSIATLVICLFVQQPAPRQLPLLRTSAPPNAPNVLLVTLDTLRADHLPLYGYARDTSPHLRRFAEHATLYLHAIAPSNMTLSSHASLFTGLYPSEHHAHLDDGFRAGRPLPSSIPTLAEILARRGYDTSSIAANYGYLGKGFGLTRGFQYSDARPRRGTAGMVTDYSMRALFRPLLCRLLPNRWPIDETRGKTAEEVTTAAIARIKRARNVKRPYLLFVNYLDIHNRFAPGPRRVEGSLFNDLFATMARNGRVDLPPDDRALIVSHYDDAIRYDDEQLDRLLRAVGDDTLIVITSDHGEALGDHGMIAHGTSLFEEQTRVPLIIKTPHQRERAIVSATTSIVDVFPLITAQSFVASRPVVTEAFPLVSRHPDVYMRPGRAIYREHFKLIRSSRDRSLALYDLDADRGETNNLAALPQYANVVAQMTADLDRWIAAHHHGAGAEPNDINRQTREQLRGLGYLQ
jgi:arylsulfatase A-like enzyme